MKRESPKEQHQRRVSVKSRRRFLRGLGVSLALPTFASLLPRGVRAQGDRPQRLLTSDHPTGMPKSRQNWIDRKGAAHNAEVPAELLARFDPVAHRMSLVRNMDANIHKYESGMFTGHSHMSGYFSLYNGYSVQSYGNERRTFDQYIALDERHQGSARSSVSISLGMKTAAQLGVEPVYFNSPSWRGPGQAVAPFADPRYLFEQLFGRGGSTTSTPEEEAARRAMLERKQLFLDVAVDQVRSLKRELGSEDQVRLDEFLTSVEELDRRTQNLLERRNEMEMSCSPDDPPPAYVDGQSVRIPLGLYIETMDVMQDVVVRAFQCDMTRVVTFAHAGPAGGGYSMSHPWLADQLEGNSTHWHGLSHWFDPASGGDPNVSGDIELNKRDFIKVIAWHYDRMREFIEKLEATPGTWDGDSLLDETLVAAGTSLDWPGHTSAMLHQMIFGSGNGAFREALDVNANFDHVSGTANLWLTIMRGFGLDHASYGESNGIFESMLA